MRSEFRPLVGITGRRLPGVQLPMESRYQSRDFDMFFSDFARVVAAAGGTPVWLPYESDDHSVISRLDGLLLTGGQDVAPETWGGSPHEAAGAVDPARDAYEIALLSRAVARDVPVLGICRGMQLINVARGGTLVSDLPTEGLDHRGPGLDVDELVHSVVTAPDSIARLLYGESVDVNSLHHQACATPGRGVAFTGSAADGTAEILELDGARLLAVQWHPEWMPGPDPALRWLIDEASTAEVRS